MAHSKEVRTKAKQLFVHQHYTIATIAVTLGVSPATVTRWKAAAKEAGDNWDQARSAVTMSAEGKEAVLSEGIEGFIVLFHAQVEEIQSNEKLDLGERIKMMASLSDSFNKMMVASARAAPKLNKLGIATKILESLADFIRAEFPQHSEAFLEVLEPFGVHLAAELVE